MVEKILIVSRHFWPENCRQNNLCENLTALGLKTDILCGQPSSKNGEYWKEYGAFKVRREVHNKLNIYRTVDVKKGNNSSISIFQNYLTFPIAALFLLKKLIKNKYDAVLVYQTSPVFMCLPALKISKKMNLPLYIYVADLWPQSSYGVLDVQSSLFQKILHRISMHFYKSASKLVVPSEKIKKYFLDELGYADDQIVIINRPPLAEYEAEERDDDYLEKVAGSFNLLMIGDFNGQISVNTIVNTAEFMRKDFIRDIRFIVLGKDEKIQELQKEVHKRSLHDYFFFEGEVKPDKIGKYIHIADALLGVLRPDLMNGYMVPEQAIDYFAAGKLLIFSAGGILRDAMKKAGCGLVSEPEDVLALYNNIMKIYHMSPENRTQMENQARAFRQKYFNRMEIAEKLKKVICGEQITDQMSDDSTIQKLWDL